MTEMEEAPTKPSVAEKAKGSWSFRKKLLAAVIIIIAVVALAVGLGVGLTIGRGDGDGGQDNGGDGDLPGQGPNRTETWRPKVNDSWQIILKKPMVLPTEKEINPDVAVYDLDLFDNEVETFKILQNAGKKVICYFSAGSYEDWRTDKDKWDQADLGKELDGWPGERWVNVSSPGVHSVMKERISLAWKKGCDAIDPDNVDGFQNENGLDLTAQDSVNFMRFLADEAGQYNMSIGLKNAGDIIPDVIDFIDFSVNEQCIEYGECETFAAFIEADKPVFNIEYPTDAPEVSSKVSDDICSKQDNAKGTDGFSIVIKKMELDGWVEYCDGKTFTTEVQS